MTKYQCARMYHCVFDVCVSMSLVCIIIYYYIIIVVVVVVVVVIINADAIIYIVEPVL